jgi:hypothetical protein
MMSPGATRHPPPWRRDSSFVYLHFTLRSSEPSHLKCSSLVGSGQRQAGGNDKQALSGAKAGLACGGFRLSSTSCPILRFRLDYDWQELH